MEWYRKQGLAEPNNSLREGRLKNLSIFEFEGEIVEKELPYALIS